MKSPQAQALLANIDTAIADIDGFGSIDSKAISYLTKYLAVFICGIYEEAIELIVAGLFARTGNAAVEQFGRKSVEKGFRNPNIDNVCKLLSLFDDSWPKIIKALPPENKEALNSIVSNKNLLAH